MNKVLFNAALSSDTPLLTNDPEVNHAVDQHTSDEVIPYDEATYLKEIHHWKMSGGKLLSWE